MPTKTDLPRTDQWFTHPAAQHLAKKKTPYYHNFQYFRHKHSNMRFDQLMIILAVLCRPWTTAFVLSPSPRSPQSSSFSTSSDDESPHPMSDTSFLSHIMLKVPSVDDTVKYWTNKGGTVRASSVKDETNTANGSVELRSAFVELGCLNTSSNKDKKEAKPVSFALELVATNKESYSIGNAISYIGVSMLLQFQNNLLGAIQGESPQTQGEEPNSIPVQSSASAPGDLLARIALKSRDLVATHQFYTTALGMDAKAQDNDMVCLRYDNACFTSGVPTTLVFEKEEGDIEMGDCFDHFVIATKTSIEDLYALLQKQQDTKIFMKPTEMFGKKVMGLIDPNGYKVILASA